MTVAAGGASGTALTCAAWNLHRARGNDGVVDPARTLDVLLAEVWRPGTDALILTEADAEPPSFQGLLDLARLSADTGLRHAHPGRVTWDGSHGFHGIVLLVADGIEVEEVRLVDLPGVHHRGAVVADLSKDGVPLRLIGAHLSLGQVARVAQTRTLGQHLDRHHERQTILVGDLNEWRPWGGAAFSRAVVGRRLSGPARGTFPWWWPVLPLDRVLVTAEGAVTTFEVLDGPGIRATSDHRPIRATVRLGP